MAGESLSPFPGQMRVLIPHFQVRAMASTTDHIIEWENKQTSPTSNSLALAQGLHPEPSEAGRKKQRACPLQLKPRESVGSEFGTANSHRGKENHVCFHWLPREYPKLQATTSQHAMGTKEWVPPSLQPTLEQSQKLHSDTRPCLHFPNHLSLLD